MTALSFTCDGDVCAAPDCHACVCCCEEHGRCDGCGEVFALDALVVINARSGERVCATCHAELPAAATTEAA